MSARFGFGPGVQRRACAAVLISALLWVSAGGGIADEKPIVHTILIEGTSFTPQSLIVRRGDTVVWKNKDPFPHTVTARNRQFDSGILAEDQSWQCTAKDSGEFPYFCTLHQTMTGELVVK